MENSVSFGWPLWAGLVLGALIGWTSEWSTRLALRGLLGSKASFLRPLARWLTFIFFLAKQGVLWLLVYLVLSSLHLSLVGFAAGILAYQLYRLTLMIFWPRAYLGQRTTS